MHPLEWFDGKNVNPHIFRAAVRKDGRISTLDIPEFEDAIGEIFTFLASKIAGAQQTELVNGLRCSFWLDRASIEFYPTLDSIFHAQDNVVVALMTGNLRNEWVRCAQLDDGGAKHAFREAVGAYHMSLIPLVSDGIKSALSRDPSLNANVGGWTIEFWDSDRSKIEARKLAG
jgi:hypothetical protein